MQTVKLYPSATEYQRANDDEVPLSWAVDYLRKLLGSIPNAEQASAVLRGWKGVEVFFSHTPTSDEALRATLAEAQRILLAAREDGQMDAEELKRLRQVLLSVQ